MTLRLGLSALIFALAGSASAQPAPSRRDFHDVFRSEGELVSAATSSPRPEDGPARQVAIPPEQRFGVRSRVLPLGGNQYAALMFAATRHGDVNGASRFNAYIAILRRDESTWSRRAFLPVDLFEGGYLFYEARPVRIFRLEDVDDDGEEELLIVLATDTEMEGGIGSCVQQQTALVDISSAELAFNVATRLQCGEGYGEYIRGTARFADRNGDGHRDLIHRRQRCAHRLDDGDSPRPLCSPPEVVVRLYRRAEDDYAP